MAAGDATVIGVYECSATGLALAETDITAAQSGAANDKFLFFPIANGMQVGLIWVEGA